MKKRTLGFKLIAGGILAVVIPLLVVGLFSVNKASDALTTLSKEQVTNIAKDLAGMTQLVLLEEIKLAKEISTGNASIRAAEKVAAGNAENAAAETKILEHELSRTMETLGNDYESIVVTDVDGTVIADGSNGTIRGISLADRDYFKAAKQGGKVSISTPVKSKVTGNVVVPICAPMHSDDGRFIGTGVIVLNIDFLSDKITSVTVGKTGYPYMIDSNGLTIAHPNKKHILELNFAKLNGMKKITGKMMALETGVESYTFEGMEKIAGFAPVALTGWSISVTQPTDEFMGAAHAIRNIIIIVGSIFFVITLIAVFLFSRSITRPINRIIEGLNEGADQVASASGQVSSASQSLAEGSSEQAAALEETSSSLEEMSSMTKQNADNASQADHLMKEASMVIGKANDSMKAMAASMEDISRASGQTSKIIKTIDEIAFQTNLLALNAAVEAARAGEAGAGFAVVADEVKNLAMRSAEAAKNTADLIEGTVKKVADGSALVNKTNEGFAAVADSTGKVAELVAEIAAASNEQARGIEQVNTAVMDMDKVTQQNAANAEESASAAEEMNAQAEQMKGVVGELLAVVGGNEAGGNGSRKIEVTPKMRSQRLPAIKKRPAAINEAVYKAEAIPPQQAIPMNDEGFKDF